MIMDRKAAEFWWGEMQGKKIVIPAEVHHYEIQEGYWGEWSGPRPKPKPVTWTEIFKIRTDKQLAREERKRQADFEIKPCYFWCFKNCITFPFGGWWSGIWTLNDYYDIRGRYVLRKDLIEKVMDMFNPGLLPIGDYEHDLYEALAKNYPSNGFHKKPKRWPQALVKCYCRIEYGKVTDIFLPENKC